MIVKERNRIYLDDLLDHYVSEVDLLDLEVIAVYDTEGNRVAKGEELEIIYEITTEDNVDESEPTPKEQDDELRSLGF